MSTKIELRRLDLADIKNLKDLADSKRIWDNLRDYMPFPYTENDAISFITSTQKENPIQTFGVTFNCTLAGVIGLVIQQDVYRKSAELGYWIGESYWGKGIATKAVELVVFYGFKELGLNRIFSGVFEYNLASMRVLEKNGFKREGIFKRAILKNDQFYDEHRFYRLIGTPT